MTNNSKYYSDNAPAVWIDASYALNPREVLSLDRHVYGVVRALAIAQKYFPTIQIEKGARHREIQVAVELSEPMFTDDFMKEDLDEARKTTIDYWLAPMHKGFRIKMIDLDASRNIGSKYSDITLETLNIREATKTVADYKERSLWRGWDILGRDKVNKHGKGSIDTLVKGIVNPPSTAGSITTFAAAGDNAGMNAAGDGPLSIGAAMASLIPKLAYGPYVFIMTPDIYGQLAQNFNTTTHWSDIERMHTMIDLKGNKILEAMDVTHYLIAAEAIADNGSMLMFQRKTPDGEPTCVVLESYPVRHIPTQQNQLGIKGKVISMACAANLRPAFFTLETDVDLIA